MRMRLNSVFLLRVAAALLVPSQLGAQEKGDLARRIADIASIAVAEYAEGVAGGRIVRSEEYEEARLFLDEALATGAELEAGGRIAPLLSAMLRSVHALAPVGDLERELRELRRALEEAAGIPLDPMPERAPSLARGRAIYEQSCAQCHGTHGAGDGPLAASMDPPPADLTDSDATGGRTNP